MLFALVVLAAAVALLACAVAARVRSTALPRSLVVEYTPIQSGQRPPYVVDDAIVIGQERRAIAAGLIELASARKVRLVAETSDRGRVAVGVEIVDEASLSDSDTALLGALFGPDHPRDRVRRFSKDRRLVGRRVRAFVDDRAAALVARGVLRAGGFRPRYTIRVLAIVLLLLAAPIAALSAVGQEWPVAAVLTVATVAMIAALAVLPRGERRTPTAEATLRRRHLDGLRQYMALAEADRLRFLQSPQGALLREDATDATVTTFAIDEKLLPYAVAFGMERDWVAHLKISYAELDGTDLQALGDVTETALEVLTVAEALGDLIDLGFAVGELIGNAGDVVEVVGGVFESIGDLTP